MAVLENHFYHKTIATLTGVFGSIFDEIKIKRSDGKIILVPIAYAIKQRYEVRNSQNEDPSAARYKMQLPRLSFKLVGLRKDNERALNRNNMLVEQGVDRSTVNSLSSQYNRVPYVFSYQLNAKTKTMDDMLQIIEQIVVYFNPTLRVIVEDNPDLNQNSAITVRMTDAGIEDITEGMFESEQAIEATMNFELEGWLYMPTNTAKIIKKVTVNYLDDFTGEVLEKIVEVP
jgi:hypothetical protein